MASKNTLELVPNDSTDDLSTLRHYRVSERFHAVQSLGNPIIHSKSSGLDIPPVPHRSCMRRQLGCFLIDGASWLAVRVGVGHNEDASPRVVGANVGGRNFVGGRVVTKHVQIAPHRGQPSCFAAIDVFDDDAGRSENVNATCEVAS